MIVLLNVDWMWQTAFGTSFFTLRTPAAAGFLSSALAPSAGVASFFSSATFSSSYPLAGRLPLLLARHRLPGALPRPRVRPRPLAAHRQAPAVPAPAVAADLLQALDVLRDHAAQRALDDVALVDDRVDPRELVL